MKEQGSVIQTVLRILSDTVQGRNKKVQNKNEGKTFVHKKGVKEIHITNLKAFYSVLVLNEAYVTKVFNEQWKNRFYLQVVLSLLF